MGDHMTCHGVARQGEDGCPILSIWSIRSIMQASRRAQTAHHRLQGDLTVAEIAGKYQFHPNLVQQWKKKLQESASDVFVIKAERKSEDKPYTEDDLMKKIGRLEVENDFLRSVFFFLRVI